MNEDTEYIIKRVFDSLVERFLEQEENVVIVDRLFMAKSIVRDVVEKKFSGEYTSEAAARILKIVEKYLSGDIDLIREDGEIKVKLNTNYDEERQIALDSLRKAYSKMLGEMVPPGDKNNE